MILAKEIIIALLVLSYFAMGVIWILTDPRPTKQRFEWLNNPLNLMHQTVSVGTILLALVLFYKSYFVFPSLVIPSAIFGFIVFTGGNLFATWARFYMKEHWAPAHGGHNIEKQSKLHTGGPFQYSRNPIYTGLLLSRIGFFVTLNSWLIIVIPFYFWYFNKSILLEELLLKKYFGEKYEEYLAKVHRYL